MLPFTEKWQPDPRPACQQGRQPARPRARAPPSSHPSPLCAEFCTLCAVLAHPASPPLCAQVHGLILPQAAGQARHTLGPPSHTRCSRSEPQQPSPRLGSSCAEFCSSPRPARAREHRAAPDGRRGGRPVACARLRDRRRRIRWQAASPAAPVALHERCAQHSASSTQIGNSAQL